MTVRSFPFAGQDSAEDDYYRLHRESGVISGLDLTLSGLGWSLSVGEMYAGGSMMLVEDTPATGASIATASGATNPRRDMLMGRRTLESDGSSATVLALKQGAPASSPVDPPLTQATVGVFEEPLFSWQVPGGGGTVVTGIRDLRRWQTVASLTDTDWTNFTVNTPLTNGALGNQYRVVNSMCTVALDAAHSVVPGGGPFAAGFTIATLPQEAWPTRKLTFPVNWYGDAPAYVSVDSNGAIQVINATATHTGIIGTLNYPVG